MHFTQSSIILTLPYLALALPIQATKNVIATTDFVNSENLVLPPPVMINIKRDEESLDARGYVFTPVTTYSDPSGNNSPLPDLSHRDVEKRQAFGMASAASGINFDSSSSSDSPLPDLSHKRGYVFTPISTYTDPSGKNSPLPDLTHRDLEERDFGGAGALGSISSSIASSGSNFNPNIKTRDVEEKRQFAAAAAAVGSVGTSINSFDKRAGGSSSSGAIGAIAAGIGSNNYGNGPNPNLGNAASIFDDNTPLMPPSTPTGPLFPGLLSPPLNSTKTP